MRQDNGSNLRYELIVVAFASAVFLGSIVSPPLLMDDVDSVQAQIARNMLESGDWLTARLNGIAYLEKSPLIYWLMALSFKLFGVYDWAARLPLALSTVALCWLTARMGMWAFSPAAGLYAGLVSATILGLWLFTRIQIPDAILTLTIALAMWSFLRAIDPEEPRARRWAVLWAASIATGLLLKGLIAALFPVGAAMVYVVLARPPLAHLRGSVLLPLLVALAIALPWHVLATLRNPPYFDFTMRSEPGHYHGFFWFYFLNEHVFRFLNMRHPRDYNTVPRLYFWLFHLLWLFPWSAYLPALLKLGCRPDSRAGRMRLLALIWAAFVLVFFTFSTTQEYYSMPIYPALALLLGCAMEREHKGLSRVVGSIAALSFAAIAFILISVRGMPAPDDISRALTRNPEAYTLSLGHMGDLTLASFAYLRLPLAIAGIAFLVGAVSAFALRGRRVYFGFAIMMVLFLHAARVALVAFDPYLSSRPLAEALLRSPRGQVIFDNQYYTFSSVFFYTNTRGLLLNGRVNNLEYGSYAPGAPAVFIDDREFQRRWALPERYYLLLEGPELPRIERLAGKAALHTIAESGGKFLFSNLKP